MKKLVSVLLCLLLVTTMAQAALPDIGSQRTSSAFSHYGYTIKDASEALPETPAADQTEYSVTAVLQNDAIPGLSAGLIASYDAVDGAWQERGAALNYLYGAATTRDSYVKGLQDLINNGFESTDSLPFYNAALAFLMSAHEELSEDTAKTVLNQIIIQAEINSFNEGSRMISYAKDSESSELYDAAVDSKNLIYGGSKYLLIVQEDGYVFSMRSTEEENTIELSDSAAGTAGADSTDATNTAAPEAAASAAASDTAENTAAPDTEESTAAPEAAENTAASDTEGGTAAPDTAENTAAPAAAERRTVAPIHKQYGWDSLNKTLAEALGSDFLANQDAGFLAIPAEQLEAGKIKLFVTGNGALLAYGRVTSAFRLNAGVANAMLNALKSIINHFPTLDTYARIAGSEGLSLNVYFENNVQSYTLDTISTLADVISGALGTPVLLGEDEAVLAEEEDLTEVIEKPLPTVAADGEKTGEEEAILAEPTKAILGAEVTPTPDPKLPSEGQVEVIKKRVNIRDAAGGKIKFKVKRGDILEIIGPTVKKKGWIWYNIEFNGETGYVRSNTVKLLDYKVVITPTPSLAPKATLAATADENEESEDSPAATTSPRGAATAPPAATAAANTGSYTTLRRGSKGDAVKDLQERLIELGYLSGNADGKYGAKTDDAVKKAQKAFRQQQSGVADAALQTALFAADAVNATAAEVLASDPNNMRIDPTILKSAESYIHGKYAKTANGYTTGVSLSEADSRYTLTVNSATTNNTSYEVSIAATDATGAQNIKPRFEIRIMNLNIQDVNRIELIRGGKVTTMNSQYWKLESGLVVFDLSGDAGVLTDLLDKRITREIKLYGETGSYTIDFSATTGPAAITKYMSEVWKNLGGAKIARAADYLNSDTAP